MNSPKSKSHKLLFIGVLGLLSGLTPFSVDMYLPSIPDIANDLHSNVSQVQLTITVFLFTFAIGQLFYGPISDSWGRKKVLTLGLSIFITASILSAGVDNLNQLLLWRALQAFGGGAIGVCVTATLRDHYKGNHLAKMMSYLMMVTIIAPMIAPFIGGQILRFFGWPIIFYMLAALGSISLVFYFFLVDESHNKEQHIDFSIKSIGNNYARIIKDPHSLAYLLLGSFSSAPMFIFITSSPFVYIEYFGVSEQKFGLLFGANVLLMMASSWVNSFLLNSIPYSKIMGFAIIFRMLPATGLLCVGFFADKNLFIYLVPLIILTIGFLPLVGPNAMTGLMSKHGKNAGSAASLAGMSRFGIGALAGTLTTVFSQQNHLPMVVGMFLLTLACLIVYLWLRRLSPA
jgi:DHA1 family bicyclomycin/chloramphenicol resistance-like MFS transporter